MTKALTLAVLLFFLGFGCQSESITEKPNVLLIVADDLGYFDLGFTGSSFYETPNLDRLAKSGIQFTNAYTNSPVCSPARASIMTGQFPSRHGITDWIGAPTEEAWRSQNRHTPLLPASNKGSLDQGHTTLAEAMKNAGYATFISGKWHLGGQASTPEIHGFEQNKGAWQAGSPRGGYFDPYDNPKLENRMPGEQLSMRLADETAHFITQHHTNNPTTPFFAYLSFYAVHSPLQTTFDKWKKYRDKADSLGLSEQGFYMGQYLPVREVQDHPVYAGLIESMDEAVGHILQTLEDLHLDENTIVIFTSDNGGVSSGDHFSTSNFPFRAGKGSTFEGGIRVPFLLRAPGQTEKGTINHTPIIGSDIYPTILELTGQPFLPNQHIDGMSVLPILENNMPADRALIWHYPHYSNQDGRPSGAIRIGDWKLIYDYQTQEKELYHLVTDLTERKNLARQYPKITDQLYTTLREHLEDTGAIFPFTDPLYDAAKEQRHLDNVRTRRWPHLENQRLEFLSPDYTPNNTWWGSRPK